MATATQDSNQKSAPKFDVNAAKEKVTGFAKARPAATAALAGVLGIALINTLRGR
jgi:hypothetical protein